MAQKKRKSVRSSRKANGAGKAQGAGPRPRPRTRGTKQRRRTGVRAGAKGGRASGRKPALGTRARGTSTRRSTATKRASGTKRTPGTKRASREISLEAFAVDESTTQSEAAQRVADAMVGDEEPGGTVMVPDHDRVDEWAGALGVQRSPESPVRASSELLDDRDRRRGGRRPAPKL